mgnify:CR=1 FL=1
MAFFEGEAESANFFALLPQANGTIQKTENAVGRQTVVQLSTPIPTSEPPQEQQALQEWLEQLAKQAIAGEVIDRETALSLTKIEGIDNILLLCEAADRIRQACCGNVVDLCSIINVKSGNCSENCSFCSQSAHHPGEASQIGRAHV